MVKLFGPTFDELRERARRRRPRVPSSTPMARGPSADELRRGPPSRPPSTLDKRADDSVWADTQPAYYR